MKYCLSISLFTEIFFSFKWNILKLWLTWLIECLDNSGEMMLLWRKTVRECGGTGFWQPCQLDERPYRFTGCWLFVKNINNMAIQWRKLNIRMIYYLCWIIFLPLKSRINDDDGSHARQASKTQVSWDYSSCHERNYNYITYQVLLPLSERFIEMIKSLLIRYIVSYSKCINTKHQA